MTRTKAELLIAFTALVLGAMGYLLQLPWAEALGLLFGAVGLGMVLSRVLPPNGEDVASISASPVAFCLHEVAAENERSSSRTPAPLSVTSSDRDVGSRASETPAETTIAR